MTEEEFHISEKMLKLMRERNLLTNRDDQYVFFIKSISDSQEQQNMWRKVDVAILFLEGKNLISEIGERVWKLTAFGIDAADESDLKDFLRKKEIESRTPHTFIDNSRTVAGNTIIDSTISLGDHSSSSKTFEIKTIPRYTNSPVKKIGIIIGIFVTIVTGFWYIWDMYFRTSHTNP